MRIDIMTDIETLGNKSDSTIIQIAAIAFDIKTGEHISKFNQIANIGKNETPVKVTIDTIQWWLKPNKRDLFVELLNSGECSSEQVLRNFHSWITDLALTSEFNDIYLWGKGILFDNKMIQHQLESLGLNYPIFFRNDRDVRTLMELACIKLGITERELLEKFNDTSLVLHNAFDDVIRQINLSVYCFNELTKSEKYSAVSNTDFKTGYTFERWLKDHIYGEVTPSSPNYLMYKTMYELDMRQLKNPKKLNNDGRLQ